MLQRRDVEHHQGLREAEPLVAVAVEWRADKAAIGNDAEFQAVPLVGQDGPADAAILQPECVGQFVQMGEVGIVAQHRRTRAELRPVVEPGIAAFRHRGEPVGPGGREWHAGLGDPQVAVVVAGIDQVERRDGLDRAIAGDAAALRPLQDRGHRPPLRARDLPEAVLEGLVEDAVGIGVVAGTVGEGVGDGCGGPGASAIEHPVDARIAR